MNRIGIDKWLKSISFPPMHLVWVIANNFLLCYFVSSYNCSPSEIRLVNGSTFCSGRVEVFHDRQWGTICDNDWGLEEATVICRMLQCGSPLKAHKNAWFGQGTGRIWLDEVICEGTERSLTECSAKPWGTHNCNHENDVGVECAGKPYFVLNFYEKQCKTSASSGMEALP